MVFAMPQASLSLSSPTSVATLDDSKEGQIAIIFDNFPNELF